MNHVVEKKDSMVDSNTLDLAIDVNGLVKDGDAVVGVQGSILKPSSVERGQPSSRELVGDFEYRAQAVVTPVRDDFNGYRSPIDDPSLER